MEFKSSGNFVFYFDAKVSPSLTSSPFSLPLNTNYWLMRRNHRTCTHVRGTQESGAVDISALMVCETSWRNHRAVKAQQLVWVYMISWGMGTECTSLAIKNGQQTKCECMFIKIGKAWWINQKETEKGGKGEGERKNHIALGEQLCDTSSNLCFVYHEKIPLMLQPHQTADQVHEWHLSEPRVNPMIRRNLPKGLCSWEKCLLQRGMQKIPGRTGPPLLAGSGILEQIKAHKKWDLRCKEHLKKTFKDLLETFTPPPFLDCTNSV